MQRTSVSNLGAGADMLLLVGSLQARVKKLEGEGKKTLLKSITTSASTSALLLGLVLTFTSLYDALVTKPRADRVSRISQFNQAVNSASKVYQEVLQVKTLSKDL